MNSQLQHKMNKKILYIVAWVFACLITVGSINNAVADLTGYPIFRPFGNTTAFKDSTNYMTINKSVYMLDSGKVAKDFYVGTKGGAIYMDTLRGVKLYVTGNSFYITNSKTKGYTYFSSARGFGFEEDISGSLTDISFLDTNGYEQKRGNIWFTGGTQQLKLPSDTASDYDANDAITLNRQSGFLTTKSLTTAGNAYYDLTLVNSLITANTKIIPTIIYGGGTNTVTNVQVHHVVYSGGNIIIGIFNGNGSSLNGTVKLSYVLFN